MATTTQYEVDCPKCAGPMWDNRASKKNPKAPDFKCKDRACDGAIWPPRTTGQQRPAARAPQAPARHESGYLPGVPMEHEGEHEAEHEAEQDAPAVNPAAERFKKLVAIQRACFTQALGLAKQYAETFPEQAPSLEGVSALTAQLFIGIKEGR